MLRPQDIVVVLQIALLHEAWTYQSLADRLGMSTSEAHYAVRRLIESGLLYKLIGKFSVQRQKLMDYLQYGAPISFYTTPAELTRGIVTAHSAPPLQNLIIAHQEGNYVWPSEDGTVRGQAIKPLHRSAVKYVHSNPELYEALALFDAIRVGKVREKKLAIETLKNRILQDKTS